MKTPLTSNATTAPARALPDEPSVGIYLRVASCPNWAEVGREIRLGDDDVVLGRSGGMHFADARLSKRHCRISPVSGGHKVTDLKSSNGTFLDGQPVKSGFLVANAVLRIGDTVLVVDEDPPADAFPFCPEASGAEATEIVGQSRTTAALRATVATAAPTSGPVLVLGPTGAGKEVVARTIHRLSGRGALVSVNCAALVSELAEAELFGHTKGAFTSAMSAREGLFAGADGGTLFLDEIGDMPVDLQAKLLRAIETGEIRPVGGNATRAVDVRVVAATNRSVDAGGFRGDLRQRLAEWVIQLSALAERQADVLVLWWHMVEKHAPAAPRPGVGDDAAPCTAEFAEALLLYDWPGNVRELEKMVRRLARLAQGHTLWDLPLLPSAMQRPVRRRTTGASHSPTRERLVAALRETGGNVKRAAQVLACHRNQLYRWLKELRIDVEDYR